MSGDSVNRVCREWELTAREVQVITLTACGCSRGQVAQILGLSPLTIKTHLRRIALKLGCSSRAEIVTRACRLGIVAGPAARGEVDGERF